MDDVYNMLKASKSPDESFSEEIRKLCKRKSIMEFAGMWSNMSDKEADKIEKALSEMRKSSRIEELYKDE